MTIKIGECEECGSCCTPGKFYCEPCNLDYMIYQRELAREIDDMRDRGEDPLENLLMAQLIAGV